MSNVSNIPALSVPAMPASVEPDSPPALSSATDPNLQNNGPRPEIALTRVATASASAIVPAVAESYAFVKHIKGNPTSPVFNKVYTPARIATKVLDLPFRLAVYAPTIGNADVDTGKKGALITKAATQVVDLATEAGLMFGNQSNAQLEHVVIPTSHQAPRSGSQENIPMQDLPRPSPIQSSGQSNPAFNNTNTAANPTAPTVVLDEPSGGSTTQRGNVSPSGEPVVRSGPRRRPAKGPKPIRLAPSSAAPGIEPSRQNPMQGSGQNNPASNNTGSVSNPASPTTPVDPLPGSSVIQRSSTPSSREPFVHGSTSPQPGDSVNRPSSSQSFIRDSLARQPVNPINNPSSNPPFIRDSLARQPVNPIINPSSNPPFIRDSLARQPVNPINVPSSNQPFVRGGPGRQPVPPPKPILPAPSSAATWIKGLNHVSNGANAISGAIDIYFGMKAVVEEPEPLAKTQGALFTASGAATIGATAFGAASLFGFGGAAAAAAVPALSIGAAVTGLAALGMSTIPAIHGLDNQHRGYKVHNDLMYDIKQVELADEQVAQRTGERFKSDLGRLNERYGIEPKTVWLNNNSADLMNEMNSPNNTGTGQWKPDANGNVWSDFRDKYISIGGTPHQQTASLDLNLERDGSSSVPATRETVHVAGDADPDKKPQQINAQASEHSHYTTGGWRHNTQQPWLYKDYGYKTSSWGHYWETSIPATVSGGPLYVARDYLAQGKDRVVLIEDTRLAPTSSLPNEHFAESALFQFDGHDAQRLTARQVAALQLDGTPAMIPAAPDDKVSANGMKFNVSESQEKSREDTYREAVYPMSNLPHVRSPDAFDRTIATDPSVRTVVSLPYVRHPLKIVARNANDVIDLPNIPEADIHITLPAMDAAADKRRLGLNDGLSARRLTPADAAIQTYVFPNKKTLTIQADDGAAAARFAQELT